MGQSKDQKRIARLEAEVDRLKRFLLEHLRVDLEEYDASQEAAIEAYIASRPDDEEEEEGGSE